MSIEHILKLSRLKLPEKEKEKIEKEFSAVLKFVKKIQDVDVSMVEPLKHIEEIKNIIREDEEVEKKEEKNQKLVNLAPDKKESYIKTKQIL